MTPAERKAEKIRNRREAQIGLASNVLGLTAGTAALGAALKDERLASGGKVARGLHKVGRKIPRGPFSRMSAKNAKTAGMLAAGAVGLQAANTAGDVIANRVLQRSANQKVKKEFVMHNEQGISKAYVSPEKRGTGHGVNIAKKYDKENMAQNAIIGAGIGGAAQAANVGYGLHRAKKQINHAFGTNFRHKDLIKLGLKEPGVAAKATRNLGIMGGIGAAGGLAYSGYHKHKANSRKAAAEERKMMSKADYGRATSSASMGVLSDEHYNRAAHKARKQLATTGGAAYGAAGALLGAAKSGKKGALIGAGIGGASGAGLFGGAAHYAMKQPENRKRVEGRLAAKRMADAQLAAYIAQERKKVSKAYRRFDPEADRQRRIGLYAGTGVGGGLLLGGMGAQKLKGSKIVLPKGGKKGLALLAAGLGSGALGVKAYKRGIEVRNQPWT